MGPPNFFTFIPFSPRASHGVQIAKHSVGNDCGCLDSCGDNFFMAVWQRETSPRECSSTTRVLSRRLVKDLNIQMDTIVIVKVLKQIICEAGTSSSIEQCSTVRGGSSCTIAVAPACKRLKQTNARLGQGQGTQTHALRPRDYMYCCAERRCGWLMLQLGPLLERLVDPISKMWECAALRTGLLSSLAKS